MGLNAFSLGSIGVQTQVTDEESRSGLPGALLQSSPLKVFFLKIFNRILLLSQIGLEKPPGLSFINVLRTAFTLADPKRVKKTVKLSIFFTLLGSTGAKAAHRTLMKLAPDLVSEEVLTSFQFSNKHFQFLFDCLFL